MNYWLMKSEPEKGHGGNKLKPEAKGEGWGGVRNYQASNNMKKKGERRSLFFFSLVKKKIFLGVKIVKKYHPDPTDKSKRFGMVSVAGVKGLAKIKLTSHK
ncbi:MAG: hypothetical protein CM15mP16_12560 [Candidatus Pelagibacterales bacterium]|nr:MAG: hypothetical protein CM15mP16_12560 [Pelagibacterales bacterium]